MRLSARSRISTLLTVLLTTMLLLPAVTPTSAQDNPITLRFVACEDVRGVNHHIYELSPGETHEEWFYYTPPAE